MYTAGSGRFLLSALRISADEVLISQSATFLDPHYGFRGGLSNREQPFSGGRAIALLRRKTGASSLRLPSGGGSAAAGGASSPPMSGSEHHLYLFSCENCDARLGRHTCCGASEGRSGGSTAVEPASTLQSLWGDFSGGADAVLDVAETVYDSISALVASRPPASAAVKSAVGIKSAPSAVVVAIDESSVHSLALEEDAESAVAVKNGPFVPIRTTGGGAGTNSASAPVASRCLDAPRQLLAVIAQSESFDAPTEGNRAGGGPSMASTAPSVRRLFAKIPTVSDDGSRLVWCQRGSGRGPPTVHPPPRAVFLPIPTEKRPSSLLGKPGAPLPLAPPLPHAASSSPVAYSAAMMLLADAAAAAAAKSSSAPRKTAPLPTGSPYVGEDPFSTPRAPPRRLVGASGAPIKLLESPRGPRLSGGEAEAMLLATSPGMLLVPPSLAALRLFAGSSSATRQVPPAAAAAGGAGEKIFGSSAPGDTTHLASVAPTVDAASGALAVSFLGSRILLPSSKNFLVCRSGGPAGEAPGEPCLQFGKSKVGLFACDFRYPLCPLQAFAMALCAWSPWQAHSI